MLRIHFVKLWKSNEDKAYSYPVMKAPVCIHRGFIKQNSAAKIAAELITYFRSIEKRWLAALCSAEPMNSEAFSGFR